MKSVRDWIWLILAGAMIVLGYIFLERNKDPKADLAREFDALQEAALARKAMAELGHSGALEVIERRHAAKIAALDEKARQEASRLADDPEALSRFLVRAGS